ncbi:MAG TPA: alpha/beta fold hydrolase, partial [Demequina sp.]|nr:alpha/beta fold hydrolase [Demequina sp.]
MSLLPTGTPLVLLNAFPLDREQWEPLLAALDASVGDIITFDSPGIGDMPASPSDPSIDLIADAAVAALREATGSQDAIWVGCSMGGYVAMAVLERHPDAVAGLGLIGTRAGADTAQAHARRLEA